MTTPNSKSESAHKKLLAKIEVAGFSRETLRDFFWLLGAHDQLISFPKICQNVLKIFDLVRQHWGFTESHFHLNGLSPILLWIVDNQANLVGEIGEQFTRSPRRELDHPIVGHNSSQYPLYTSLWNSCGNTQLQEKYSLLQAHLFYAHAESLFKINNRNDYENNLGRIGWKGLINSPYAAALSLRELSLVEYSTYLSNLPVELTPYKFAESIENISQINDQTFLTRINNLATFVQKSVGVIRWRPKKGASHASHGGSKWIKGYVGNDFKIKELSLEQLSDLDDPDDDWGIFSQLSEIELESKLFDELNDLDLNPQEYDSQDLFLSEIETGLRLGGYSAATAAQVRHVSMANQLLPWNYSYLSIQELAIALDKTTRWCVSIQSKESFDQSDMHKLEAICLMRVMLFTASAFERARQLLILPSTHQNESAALALITDDFDKVLWRIHAIQPDYKTTKQVNDGTEKKLGEYFYLDDLANTKYYLKLLLQKRQYSSKSTVVKSKRSYHFFRTRPNTLLDNLKALLKEIDPSGRLTVSKLSKFMFGLLLKESKGDVCAASTIAGEEHPLAHVRMFYSMISIADLQRQYFNAVQNVVVLTHQAQNKVNTIKQSAPTELQDFYVGSRLCPTFEAVKNAITRLRGEIQTARKNHDEIRFHNLFTLLTLWRFAFATACRAIETPYLPTAKIDEETGIGALSDKDNCAGYKTRLIWLPQEVYNLMTQYEVHSSTFLNTISANESRQDYTVFLIEKTSKGRKVIKEVTEVVSVSPKKLLPVMSEFLNYPANFHRRFMRSELITRGCPMEVVDGWMGHWSSGEEPWATHSSFSFLQYQHALQIYLVPILKEIGLLARLNIRPRYYRKKSAQLVNIKPKAVYKK